MKQKLIAAALIVFACITIGFGTEPNVWAAQPQAAETQTKTSGFDQSAPVLKSVKKSSNKKALVLRWEKNAGADGYYVYRKTSPTAKWKKVATLKSKTTAGNITSQCSYKDTDVKWTHRYYYTVKAWDKTGNTATVSKYDKAGIEFAAKSTKAKKQTIKWNKQWKYAKYSVMHSDSVTLYRAKGKNRKDIIVCVNAGHGTQGGYNKKTKCHPDGSRKVTGGSTPAGAIYATAISAGTDMSDGSSEGKATLALAKVVKKQLLAEGYDVLMIRENNNSKLDNIARAVYANNCADCHISLHYDSTSYNKGLFFASVPDVSSYRKMEPVASWWKQHNKLGNSIVKGAKKSGVKIYRNGKESIDLTQTSYSTIPSVLVEVGDRTSSRSKSELNRVAEGIVNGLNIYYKFSK